MKSKQLFLLLLINVYNLNKVIVINNYHNHNKLNFYLQICLITIEFILTKMYIIQILMHKICLMLFFNSNNKIIINLYTSKEQTV